MLVDRNLSRFDGQIQMCIAFKSWWKRNSDLRLIFVELTVTDRKFGYHLTLLFF